MHMEVTATIGRRLLLAALLCCGAAGLAAAAFETGSHGDAVPPAVSIRSPSAGAVVVGEIAVYAQAGAADGIAGVQFMLDGWPLAAEISSPPYTITWNTETVADGVHTLAARARHADGQTGYSATVTVIVANRPPPPGATRVEETDPAIVWSSNWVSGSVYGPWSGGSARHNVDPGAYATFGFTGSGVGWIGYRGPFGGIVRLYIDWVLVAELDTYAPDEEIAVPVYTVTGLAPGSHELMIELTGLKNPEAVSSETAIDAFDVMP